MNAATNTANAPVGWPTGNVGWVCQQTDTITYSSAFLNFSNELTISFCIIEYTFYSELCRSVIISSCSTP